MVCFAPHVSSALVVREGVPVEEAYGFMPGAGAVPGSTGTDAVPDSGSANTVPDPFDDAEALEELEEEITTLAAHIHAATHRLLSLIAEFDRRRGWELGATVPVPTGSPSGRGSTWARPGRRYERRER